MSDAAQLPGVRFEVRPQPDAVQPLRTDIAGFMGSTLRGPVGEVVRIDGWRAFVEIFGELTQQADTPYALRGYFENGGEIAYVTRLASLPQTHADAIWTVGDVNGDRWKPSAPIAGRFAAASFRIAARTPGAWANGLQIKPRYRQRGSTTPEVDLEIIPEQGAGEFLVGLPTDRLIGEVHKRSQLIDLEIHTIAPAFNAADLDGPLAKVWPPIILRGGGVGDPGEAEYATGAGLLADTREVALMAAPDLDAMPGDDAARMRIVGLMAGLAEQVHDRQVIGALPRAATDLVAISLWLHDFRALTDGEYARSLALYHPYLAVRDPLGGLQAPLRHIAPVGHVAGVISRLDRERGAHHTPANAELYQAVDIDQHYTNAEVGALATSGVNPLLCATGQGIMLWGGRTAYPSTPGTSGLFLAHRRLIHRLVRAIRRVAEPIVFDNNGPDLWLTLVRAITSLLLDAWNAGALKGDVPEEAFLVRCDANNNPPELEEAGQVLCEISLAPAAPMEFITLRIAMTREGRLEAIEFMMPDPVQAFRFIVTLDRADAYLPPSQAARLQLVAPGEFREAKGLGADLEVMGYAEGGNNGFVHQLPVRHSWSRIVLQRGVVKDPVLWNWYESGLTQSLGARRDGSILLLRPDGSKLMAWNFKGGIAAKWSGPDLNAMDNAIAIESLEIAHHGLTRVPSRGTLDIGEFVGDVVDAVGGLFD